MEQVLLFNDVIDVKSKILYYTIVKPTGEWRNNDDINTFMVIVTYNINRFS